MPVRLLFSVPHPACRCGANLHPPGGGEAFVFAHGLLRFQREQCTCVGVDDPTAVGRDVSDTLCVLSLVDAGLLLLTDYDSVFESDSVPVFEEEVYWLTPLARSTTLAVRPAAGAGLGLFAEDDVPSGTLLGEYGGLLTVDAPAVSSAPVTASAYAVAYPGLGHDGRASSVDASAVGSLLRRVNHGEGADANCAFAIGWYGVPGQEPTRVRRPADATPLGPARVFMVTLRDVSPGEQLLADYGKAYWAARAGEAPVSFTTASA